MLDAVRAIQRFTAGRARESLDDEILFWALVAQVAMLGEAASRVGMRTQARLEGIRWREIVGMRNQLVHGYWSIDPDELWRTIERDIPILASALESEIAGPSPEGREG